MFELEITLLTGRYVATSDTDRGRAEWPPHPARVYSALVATWAEGPEDDDERAVLEWLESLPAPEILASVATERPAVTHYVPVNDPSVVGLAVTERRTAKIEHLGQELVSARATQGARAARRVSTIQAKIAALLDVSSKVESPGRTNISEALEMLPNHRTRQPRQWPSVSPASPVVSLRWPSIDPSSRTVSVLDDLCSRMARLGHSSSLVSVRALAQPAFDRPASWRPDATGSTTIRWVQPGQLRALEAAYAQHQGSRPRALPNLGVRYRNMIEPMTTTAAAGATTTPAVTSALSGEWFVFALDGCHRHFPTVRTRDLTQRFREAVLSHAPEPVHPVISGHQPDGRPTTEPHLSILALPFVGHQQATGHVLGLAVMLPHCADPDGREQVIAALGSWLQSGAELKLGRYGILRLRATPPGTELRGLHRATWAGPAATWLSVTPVALPRHPGPLRRGSAQRRARSWRNAEQSIIDACGHVGLPEPEAVQAMIAPPLTGAERASAYPPFHQGGTARALLHTKVTFREPVQGPLVLGSGRYLGLGLMRPHTPDLEPMPSASFTASGGATNGDRP